MKIEMKKEVEAKTLTIYIKVCDQFCADIKDQNGESIKDYEGYVPEFMPGEHFGDHLVLDIELATGRILNWKPPSREVIEKFVNGYDE